MNPIFIPELFSIISINLSDREKVFLTSSSKITYGFKSLLVLDLEYNLKEINDKWKAKNIIIEEFSPEEQIRELIKNLIPESIILHLFCIKFISNNTNIKLFYSEKISIIEKMVFYEYHYLAMKIMLSNDNSIENINRQLMKASVCGYLSVVKLLTEMGSDVRMGDNSVIIYFNDDADIYDYHGGTIWTPSNIDETFILSRTHLTLSNEGYLFGIKYLIENCIKLRSTIKNRAIIWATNKEFLSIEKLLIELDVNIYLQNNEIIKCTIEQKNLDITKLLKIDY